MSGFRQMKANLLNALRQQNWRQFIQGEIDASDHPIAYVGPFLSFLLREDVRWQATWGMAYAVQAVAAQDKEAARTVMRRLMWSMNEESGNIGWGIPEVMGAILARTPFLAEEYWRILFSYVRETGGDDNFIDHEPLRRGAYWGIAHLAAQAPRFSNAAFARLVPGLEEDSPAGKAVAAWGLAHLLEGRERENDPPPLDEKLLARAHALLGAILQAPDSAVAILGEEREDSLHALVTLALAKLPRV